MRTNRNDVILSKTQIRINNRRNSLNIRAMHERIEKIEAEMRKKELVRTNEKKHIEKIIHEWKMQMEGSSTKTLRFFCCDIRVVIIFWVFPEN